MQFRFDEAEATHRAAIEVEPNSFATRFAFGIFCQELNRFDQARPAYERALAIARKGAREADVAMALNNLGMLLRDQNRMEQAREAYEEALKTYRRLATENPETYLPDVARTLKNLGILTSVPS